MEVNFVKVNFFLQNYNSNFFLRSDVKHAAPRLGHDYETDGVGHLLGLNPKQPKANGQPT